MTTLYKLTRADFTTYNDTLWGEGVTHSGTGIGELCGPGWIHAYTHPLLAVLLNPIHANYNPAVLWECEGEIDKNDRGLKVGSRALTTVRQIEMPKISTAQRVTFGIYCALAVYKDEAFHKWAQDWLNGTDRTAAATAAPAATAAATAAAAAATAAAALNLIVLAQKAMEIEQ